MQTRRRTVFYFPPRRHAGRRYINNRFLINHHPRLLYTAKRGLGRSSGFFSLPIFMYIYFTVSKRKRGKRHFEEPRCGFHRSIVCRPPPQLVPDTPGANQKTQTLVCRDTNAVSFRVRRTLTRYGDGNVYEDRHDAVVLTGISHRPKFRQTLRPSRKACDDI